MSFRETGFFKASIRFIKSCFALLIISAITLTIFYVGRSYDHNYHSSAYGNYKFSKLNIVENNVLHKYLQDSDIEITLIGVKINHNNYRIKVESINANPERTVVNCRAFNNINEDVNITMTIQDSALTRLVIKNLINNKIKIYQ